MQLSDRARVRETTFTQILNELYTSYSFTQTVELQHKWTMHRLNVKTHVSSATKQMDNKCVKKIETVFYLQFLMARKID